MKHSFLLVIASAILFGQNSSTITGLVRDASQAIVPGASVTVISVETTVKYAVKTNASGYYTMPTLPPATYRVEVDHPGFKKAESAPFAVDAAANVRVDITLVPAESRQTVEVTAAAAPAIETEKGMVGPQLAKRNSPTCL